MYLQGDILEDMELIENLEQTKHTVVQLTNELSMLLLLQGDILEDIELIENLEQTKCTVVSYSQMCVAYADVAG